MATTENGKKTATKTPDKTKTAKVEKPVENKVVEGVIENIEEKATEALEKVNEVAEEIVKSQETLAAELDKLDITKKEDNEKAKAIIEKEIKKVEGIKVAMSNGRISAAWNGSGYLY